MIFNPLLKRNGVEVTSINEEVHSINFVVHVSGQASDVQKESGRARISAAVHDMVRYLELEDFIQPKQNWLTHMGIVVHNAAYAEPSVKLNDYEQN